MDTFEQLMFQYLDRFKLLFFPEQWDNRILDCSKNEMFVLLLVYRREVVTMTELAEYIHVPLNTATGIISRMEKKAFLLRERSTSDKRVVTVRMAEEGILMMQKTLGEIAGYGQKVMQELTPEETTLLIKVVDKIIGVLQKETCPVSTNNVQEKTIRKIQID